MDLLKQGSFKKGSAGSVTATGAVALGRGRVAGGRPRVHNPPLGCNSALHMPTLMSCASQQLHSTMRAALLAASGDAGRTGEVEQLHRHTAVPYETPRMLNPQAASRRGLLLGSATVAAAALAPWLGLDTGGAQAAAAAGALLHSRRSDVPCSLTIRNRSAMVVEARWVNYDGDEEPYATIPPGHEWTVDTFETHPWRFRDARTGGLVVEYVAARGPRLLQLTDTGAAEAEPAGSSAQGRGARQSQASDSPATRTGSGSPHAIDDMYADEDGSSEGAVTALQPEPPATGLAGGFDGLGHLQAEYTLATLLSVGILTREEQALLVLGLEAYPHPLTLLVGLLEAGSVIDAAGGSRGRRPSMLATWANTLQALGGKVERVVITRQVGGIFYARIVLSQPEQPQQSQPRGLGRPGAGDASSTGGRRIVSVDARPSDALSLALEAGVDVFVSRPVAQLVQRQYEDAERELPDLLLPPPEGGPPGLGLDEAGQYAAGRQLRSGAGQLAGEAMSA